MASYFKTWAVIVGVPAVVFLVVDWLGGTYWMGILALAAVIALAVKFVDPRRIS